MIIISLSDANGVAEAQVIAATYTLEVFEINMSLFNDALYLLLNIRMITGCKRVSPIVVHIMVDVS